MIVILFFCVKLAIIHLSVSDFGYQCESAYERDVLTNKPAIILIAQWGRFNDILIRSFKRECHQFYHITVKDSLETTKEDDNIICFAVLDYDHEVLLHHDFEYAGNVSDANDAVCNKTGTLEQKYDCHEIPNIVSSTVLKTNDGDLYDYVQRMKIITDSNGHISTIHRKSCKPSIERKISNLTIIVLCRNETVQFRYYKRIHIVYPLKLIVTYSCSIRDLQEHNDRLLAVLAPKPFEVATEYSVPTIFYEIPYMTSEYKNDFPNSMNIVPWRLLKYGFLKFMQTMGWQRVLIVTDDSEYSLEFENELIGLFNKERMIYTVIRCEDANCEMDKMKQELNRVSANIVIANVEEEHAQYLFENAHHNITWIVRDMAKSKIKPGNNVVFSISLRSVNNTRGCNWDDNILAGLSSIALAYKNIAEKDYEVKIHEFYRHFAVKAEQMRETEAEVVVNKLDSWYYDYRNEISTMYVNESGAELLTFKNPYISIADIPSDGTRHCLAKSYDYFKPCEDTLVILLSLILLLFVITFVLIIRYFHRSSPGNDKDSNILSSKHAT